MTLPTTDAERKALPLWDFMFGYFPDAWLAVANVAVEGNKQHNPGEPLHWAREKSTDQLNTAFRHQFDYGQGTKIDTDGQPHLAKAIWRLMARLQLDIEQGRAESTLQSAFDEIEANAEPTIVHYRSALGVDKGSPGGDKTAFSVVCPGCGTTHVATAEPGAIVLQPVWLDCACGLHQLAKVDGNE